MNNVDTPGVLFHVWVVDVDHSGLVPGEVDVVHLVRGPEDRPLVADHLAVDVVHDIIVGPHSNASTGHPQHTWEHFLLLEESVWKLEVPRNSREVSLQLDRPLPGIVLTDSPQVILLSLRVIWRCCQWYHLLTNKLWPTSLKSLSYTFPISIVA